jgi:hypothetical protein
MRKPIINGERDSGDPQEGSQVPSSYRSSSFASLTDRQGNYVQVACGGITCMVERREESTAKQYRAHQKEDRKGCPDGTWLAFGGGTIPLKSDEWLSSDQGREIFLASLGGREMPKSIFWREVALKEV